MIKSVDVKNGLDISDIDGIVVLNSISLAEKEEKEEQKKAEESSTTITPDVKLNPESQDSNYTNESEISVPNIEIPIPEVSQVSMPEVSSTITTPGIEIPNINSNSSTFSSAPEQTAVFSNQDLYNSNIFNQQEYSKSFKTIDSVIKSRNDFLSECSKLFDEKLKIPVENLVKITNGAIQLLDDVFINGIRKKSFDSYNEFKKAYENLNEVNEFKQSSFNESNYNDFSHFDSQDESSNNSSNINFPRF